MTTVPTRPSRRRTARRTLPAIAIVLVLLLGACERDDAAAPGTATTPSGATAGGAESDPGAAGATTAGTEPVDGASGATAPTTAAPPFGFELPDEAPRDGDSILQYLGGDGDRVVVVPDGRYSGGEITLDRQETGGDFAGWLVLVAATRGGVVIDQTPEGQQHDGLDGAGPLVLEGDVRTVFVGFAFENGPLMIEGDRVRLWYTDHTFPIEEWARQSNWPSQGLNVGTNPHQPFYTTAETILVGPNTAGIEIMGADIHDTARGIHSNVGSEVRVVGTSGQNFYDYGADRGRLAVGSPDLRHEVPDWWQAWKQAASADPSEYNWIVVRGDLKVGYINYDAWVDGDFADPDDPDSGWRGYDPNDAIHAEFWGAFKGGSVVLTDSRLERLRRRPQRRGHQGALPRDQERAGLRPRRAQHLVHRREPGDLPQQPGPARVPRRGRDGHPGLDRGHVRLERT
jgi:hypothetical protein